METLKYWLISLVFKHNIKSKLYNPYKEMELSQSIVLQDRSRAANLLTDRLMFYKNTNALVLAVPPGGIVVGCQVAKVLNLSLDIIPCSCIKHPSIPTETIGSVCMDEVLMNDDYRDLPQDYIYHQVLLQQHGLKSKYKFYRQDKAPEKIKGRIVILVTDLLLSADAIMATIKSVSRQGAEKIVVAVPVISFIAAQQLSSAVDDVIFLLNEINESGENVYENFEEVKEEEAKNLLLNYRNN